jgi:hypothetical protein
MPTQARRTMSRRALENIMGSMRAKNELSGMRQIVSLWSKEMQEKERKKVFTWARDDTRGVTGWDTDSFAGLWQPPSGSKRRKMDEKRGEKQLLLVPRDRRLNLES